MCDFCERGMLLRSCNFCGGAKLLIHQEGFESDIGMLEVCGEENKFPIFNKRKFIFIEYFKRKPF